MSGRRVLAADVGATKTLVAAARVDAATGRVELEDVRRLESAEVGSVEAALRELAGSGPFERAGVGVCGPVVGGRSFLPHLGWEVDGAALERALGLPVVLANDFVAVAHGVDCLPPADLLQLRAGAPEARGPRAVLGAGTGLGEVVVERAGGGLVVRPSEAGHTDFAPASPDEDDLARWLRARNGRASLDAVLSGRGLANLHRFCVETERAPESRPPFPPDADPAAEVVARALAGADAACDLALGLFCAAYGSEAGNLALRSVATGGVVVAGGIAPRIAERLADGRFVAAFLDKGPMRRLLEGVPVHVALDPAVGLLGAARIAGSDAHPGPPVQ